MQINLFTDSFGKLAVVLIVHSISIAVIPYFLRQNFVRKITFQNLVIELLIELLFRVMPITFFFQISSIKSLNESVSTLTQNVLKHSVIKLLIYMLFGSCWLRQGIVCFDWIAFEAVIGAQIIFSHALLLFCN